MAKINILFFVDSLDNTKSPLLAVQGKPPFNEEAQKAFAASFKSVFKEILGEANTDKALEKIKAGTKAECKEYEFFWAETDLI